MTVKQKKEIILSFSPEIIVDWEQLADTLKQNKFNFKLRRIVEIDDVTVSGHPITYKAVEIQLEGRSTIKQFRDIAYKAVNNSDCHYILQTVRALPIEENSFVRRYDWKPTIFEIRHDHLDPAFRKDLEE